MVVEAVVDRDIMKKIRIMFAYQRDDPIQVRILTPKIRDIELDDGESIYSKIQKLILNKNALVTLIINPSWMTNRDDKTLLQKLKILGVKVHANTNLHAKMILVQNRNEKLILVGSANYTKGGLQQNDEASVYFINTEDQIYDQFYTYVTNMLKRINEYISGSDTTPRKAHLEKNITKLEAKIQKLKEELCDLGK